MKYHPASQAHAQEAEAPCLLWFRTWRGVYTFVLGCFILYIVLLAVLSRAFS